MDFLIDSFNRQDFFSLTGYLIGVIGFAWAIWSHYANKKHKMFSFSVQTFNLLNEKVKGVKDVNLTFKGLNVQNLSISEIMFWNSGTEIIDGRDIAKNNRLRIAVTNEDVEILSHKVMYSTNASNGIVFTPDAAVDGLMKSYSIDINFDYLDSQDGICIQIYHTGITSYDVTIDGAIKGVKRLHRVSNYKVYELDPTEGKENRVHRFMKSKLTPMSFPFLLLVYVLIDLFVFRSSNFSIVHFCIVLACFTITIYYINDYFIEKRNKLPKWIRHKQ